MTTAGTWYPPSAGTGGFLSDALLLSNPPFATMANITALLSARYPHGAIVRDRWGRQIPGVIAFDPETGEVISYDGTWLLWLTRRLRVGVTRHPFHWAYPCRHGFWPAPLTVEGRRPTDVAAIRHHLANGSGRPGRLTLAQLDDLIAAVDSHP